MAFNEITFLYVMIGVQTPLPPPPAIAFSSIKLDQRNDLSRHLRQGVYKLFTKCLDQW